MSIKRPVFVTMVMTALVVVGVIAYSRMAVDLLPNISSPMITVRTSYPGASPEVVEKEITKPLEDAVSPLSGVKSVNSTSGGGVSVVRVEYALEYPVDKAFSEVREKVSGAQRSLPRDADDPVVMRFDPTTFPIVTFSLADKEGLMAPAQLRRLVDNDIAPRIERVDGVASVDVSGGQQRQINVLVSLDRLQALGLSPQQVVAAIKAENADISGGTLIENDRQLTLRTPVSFKRPEEVEEVVVINKGGVPVRVKHIATVEDSFKERSTYSRLDSHDSVVVMVRKQSGTNTVQVAEGILGEIERIVKEKPNLNIVITTDDSAFIKRAVDDTLRDLILGGLLACLVVFIFFLNWRMTLITVAGLPVIVVGAFWGISLPDGVSVYFTGATQQMQESFNALYFVMMLSLIFMYMVLASQLGSFVQPLIIMMALPLSMVGAIRALLITGKYLDITAMIGMILLMGIVTKNSILLLDFANVRRRQGVEPKEAMLEAGQTRLRPVLMTSIALIFGMLPVAIGLGAGAEFRSPMAITVIGGLITATILTLVVVPVIYSLVEGLKARPTGAEKDQS